MMRALLRVNPKVAQSVTDSLNSMSSSSASLVPATKSQPNNDYSIEKLLHNANTTTAATAVSSSSSSSPPLSHPLSSAMILANQLSKSSQLPLDLLAQTLWLSSRHHFSSSASIYGNNSSGNFIADHTNGTGTASSSSTICLPNTATDSIRRSAYHHLTLQRQSPRGPRRQRTTFTHEQTLRLEMEYHVSEYITRGKRFQLAELLDLSENQIKIWFQNRRAKDKRIEKAIVEQQYRYLSTSSSFANITPNCSTCQYTKQQFDCNEQQFSNK